MYLLHGCWNKSQPVDRTLMAYNEHFSNNNAEFIMFYVDYVDTAKIQNQNFKS